MKYAFLLLAHEDPQQLRRLIHALDDPRFDFFIYVDKKSNLASFDFDSYNLTHSRITVIKNRMRLYWGDISLVDATVALYREALSSTRNYDRFITLSGLDYPIQSNNTIATVLSNPSIEFIMGNPITPQDSHKVECFYFWKLRSLGKLGSLFFLLFKMLNRKKSNYLQVKEENWVVYFAPQWHALSRECVLHILNTYDTNPEIRHYFRYAYAPDELLIPTILFNSPQMRSKALRDSFPEGTHYNKKPAIHYINYEPLVEVFTECKYPEIISSGKLFLRKAKTGISDKLLDMIDATRKDEVDT
jgi:hypothetical protein